MIKNERQYRISKAEAEKFRRVLDQLAVGAGRQGQLHPRLALAEREALQSQLNDLLQEIREYADLKARKVEVIELDSLGELPNGLIKARVACGLSQKGLAERLGLKEQQIQRYEAEGYSSASFQRLKEIGDAIGIRVWERIEIPVREDSFRRTTRPSSTRKPAPRRKQPA